MADGDFRAGVLDAVFAEVEESGLAGLALEAVARRAGTSRATLYRHFPGGRDELVDATIRREVDRFLARLVADAGPTDDLHAHLTRLLRAATRALDDHSLLQTLLADEAEAIVPSLTTVFPTVQGLLATYLADRFVAAGVAGDVDAAADHCARMFLSYVGSEGVDDLSSPAVLADLVDRILAGVV